MSNIALVPVWYFEEEPTLPVLAQFAQRKYNLKTAWAGLKTLPRYQVHVVYPAPWNIAPEQHGAWMDYYLECISLQQEYPARVVLWPLDVWLAEQGVSSATLADAQSLNAFMLHGERPDLFELLQALESAACLQAKGQKAARQPALPPQARQLSESQFRELSVVLGKAAAADSLQNENEALNADLAALRSQIDGLRAELEQACKIDEAQLREAEDKAQLLQQQLNDMAEKLQGTEVKVKTSEVRSKELEGKLKALEGKNKELEGRAKHAEGKLEPLEKKSAGLLEENRLVLEQLLTVQGQLERYYLENSALKTEALESASLMKQASLRILQSVRTDDTRIA